MTAPAVQIRSETLLQQSDSRRDIVLGTLPFALFGLVTLSTEIAGLLHMGMFLGLTLYLLLGCYALFVTLAAIGGRRGFPRWSYPYLGFILVFSMYWMSVTMPPISILGYTFQHNGFWGWRAWVLPVIALMAVVLTTRSLRTLQQLVENVWNDWTLGTFALFGILPLLTWWSRDETHGLYPVLYLAATTILLSLGAAAYMRSTAAHPRALALLLGLGFSALIMIIGSAFYWDGRIEPWMSQPAAHWYDAVASALVQLPLWLAVFFSPAIIGLGRRVRANTHAT